MRRVRPAPARVAIANPLMPRPVVLAVAIVAALPAAEARTNWHASKSATHASMVSLVSHALKTGPRRLNPDHVHAEMAIKDLPADYGLPTDYRGKLTPDIVAYDVERDQLLVIEVTVVPDAALSRYVGRKTAKYLSLCRHAAASSSADVGLPAIVAVGTAGTVPGSTRDALARILGLTECEHAVAESGEDDLLQLLNAARAIATSRADAQSTKARRTRRQRRLTARALAWARDET